MNFKKRLCNWKWWLLLPIVLVLVSVMAIARITVFTLKFIDGSKATPLWLKSVFNWVDKG